MTLLICPDSFKGSMTAVDFCMWSQQFFQKHLPGFSTTCVPLADGGEGSLAVLASLLDNPNWVNCHSVDALHRPILSQYLTCGNKAYIELAKASGLPLLHAQERNLLKSNTYGTGLLMKHACENGFKDIVLFCGGSATIDGGTGILQALGIRLLDNRGKEISNRVNALTSLHTIENSSNFRPDHLTLVVDVRNPICGVNGAARVFGPQKGGSAEVIKKLDTALHNFSAMLLNGGYIEDTAKEGLGAAGGVGLGLSLFSPVTKFGNDYFVNATNLVKQLTAADTIITGEGRFDEQSSMGKITGTVIDLCHQYKKKCIVVCGSSSTRSNAAFELINLCNESEINDCIAEPKLYLENTLKRIFIK